MRQGEQVDMLHITNGDSAVQKLLAAGVPGTIIPWRDVLHDGPVPAGLNLDKLRAKRARFIAACGWATYDQVMADFGRRDEALLGFRSHDEIVLWFEHDLYDQLQLLQILAWLSGQDLSSTTLTLIAAEEYLGPARPERLAELFLTRHPVTEGELQLAPRAWQAFTSPNPASIAEMVRADTAALPFLSAALQRHLQQFPSTRNGLSRSEEQALIAISEGKRTVNDAFLAAQASEERLFLGDTTFAWYLQRLSGTVHPLVVWAGGEPLPPPGTPMGNDELRGRPLVETDLGRAVLHGTMDWVTIAGIDRWLGGTHLTTADHWRWNAVSGLLEHHAS